MNLGDLDNPKPVYISAFLKDELKIKMKELLAKFKDFFAWIYEDMPGLDRQLVEHCLPIKDNFKPYKQPSRRMSKEVEAKINDEIEKFVKAGDLNRATPKDVYVMPITDMLIDSVANNEFLSFMDGYSGYNQINIDERDTSKTAFGCPGAIGTFEWLVMPFGLKNAGATYQRAINAIFHDMINHFIEVYIDDIVVKSRKAEDHLEHLRKSSERMRRHNLKLNRMKCALGLKLEFIGFFGAPAWYNWKMVISINRVYIDLLSSKVHKGTSIADFLAHHLGSDESIPEEVEIHVTEGTAGAGIVIISPTGVKTALSFNLDFPCTNNQAEYEALVIGLEVLKDLQAKNVQVIGDSQLVLRQVAGEYKCTSLSLIPYFAVAFQLADDFEEINFQYVPRQQNWEANKLAQIASGLRLSEELTHRLV
ncbi:uncharacterized protein [Henckelia pumila]|uniref:uncharacterized protein n=1 Tax=Henckelia pumila TaxID=405737 RepID=UPI003C6E80F3